MTYYDAFITINNNFILKKQYYRNNYTYNNQYHDTHKIVEIKKILNKS